MFTMMGKTAVSGFSKAKARLWGLMATWIGRGLDPGAITISDAVLRLIWPSNSGL